MTIFLCKLAAAQGLEPSATYDADGPPWRAKNLLTAPSSIWWQIARLDGDVVRLLLDDSARLPEVQEKVNIHPKCFSASSALAYFKYGMLDLWRATPGATSFFRRVFYSFWMTKWCRSSLHASEYLTELKFADGDLSSLRALLHQADSTMPTTGPSFLLNLLVFVIEQASIAGTM